MLGSVPTGLGSVPTAGGADSPGGGTPGGSGTLASIYAFGLADNPTADNVFAMPDGNRRWADGSSIDTSFATVSDAFWETPGATADRRVGTWLSRRWVTAGQTETTFRTDILYDATYAGTPIERSWVTETAYLTNSLSEAIVTGDQYAERKYSLHNFFGGQPASFPSPGLLTGAYSAEQTLLYNGGGFGNFKTARIVSGWGQNFSFAQPQRAGVTPGYVSVYDPGTTADAIGNGTGFWCGWGTASSFTPDQFTGGLGLTMLALDVNGAYSADIWARADHTTVNKVATFTNAGGTVLGQPIAVAYVSPDIDLAALGSTQIVPARAGMIFVPARFQFITRVAGGAVATAPTIQFFSGATAVSTASAVSPGTAQFAQGGGTSGALIGTASAAQFVSPNAALSVTVSIAATGAGIAWTGFYVVYGTWVTFP